MSEFEVAIKIAGKLDKSLQTSVSSAQKMLGSLGKGGLSSALTGIGNVMESTGKALTTGVCTVFQPIHLKFLFPFRYSTVMIP